MHTKTYLIKITTSLLLTGFVLAGAVPATEEKNTNPYGIFRIFKNIDKKHKFVGSYFYRRDNDRNITGLELSLRRKVSKFVSYGIEADVRTGMRHDDDWVWKDAKWSWEDDSEPELGTSLFLKFKRGLYFLPGTNWVGSINLKTHNNWTKTLMTLKPEASLTYIHFANGKPIYNIYTKVQYYIPLNFGQDDIYQKWLYLGTMLHWKDNLKPFLFVAYKEENWTQSKDFEERLPNEEYSSKSKLSYIGIGLNYYLD